MMSRCRSSVIRQQSARCYLSIASPSPGMGCRHPGIYFAQTRGNGCSWLVPVSSRRSRPAVVDMARPCRPHTEMGDPMTVDREHLPFTRARRSDPDTSKEAAHQLGDLRKSQLKVLAAFRQYGRMTHQVLCRVLPDMSHSGTRSRCAELVERGFVKDSEERVKLPSGRLAIVWELVPGRAYDRFTGEVL